VSAGDSYMIFNQYPEALVFPGFFSVFSILYFSINCVLFFLINTHVEIVIVKKFHQELREKRRKMQEMTSQQMDERAKLKLEEDTKKEQRAIKMVVFNSLINLAPEILIILNNSTGILFKNEVYNFFLNTPGLPLLSVDMTYLMYILTFSTNVAIYCHFNERFNLAFRFWSKNKTK
jgi:hypothetical protein